MRREGPNDTACVPTPSPPSSTGEWNRVSGAEGNDNEPGCDCCGMSRPIPGIDDSLHSGGGDRDNSEPRGCRCASSNAVGTLIRYALELPDPDSRRGGHCEYPCLDVRDGRARCTTTVSNVRLLNCETLVASPATWESFRNLEAIDTSSERGCQREPRTRVTSANCRTA